MVAHQHIQVPKYLPGNSILFAYDEITGTVVLVVADLRNRCISVLKRVSEHRNPETIECQVLICPSMTLHRVTGTPHLLATPRRS